MKGMRAAVIVTCAVLAAMSSGAQASIIPIDPFFVDIGAQGFGAAPRLLTLQTDGSETGAGTPIDVATGQAVPGANKTTTPTLTTLGWTSGAQVGIGFNSDQTGTTGITLNTLVLTIYDATPAHTALGSFSLASPVDFTNAQLDLQQGNGTAVFNFGLDATQQAQFDAILAQSGSGGFFAGLEASLGTPGQASNDGPDSFLGFAQAAGVPVPEPGSLILLGLGLTGLAAWRRFRG